MSTIGEQLQADEAELVDELRNQERQMAVAIDAMADIPHIDQRALNVARTNLQTAMMWLERALIAPGAA